MPRRCTAWITAATPGEAAPFPRRVGPGRKKDCMIRTSIGKSFCTAKLFRRRHARRSPGRRLRSAESLCFPLPGRHGKYEEKRKESMKCPNCGVELVGSVAEKKCPRCHYNLVTGVVEEPKPVTAEEPPQAPAPAAPAPRPERSTPERWSRSRKM